MRKNSVKEKLIIYFLITGDEIKDFRDVMRYSADAWNPFVASHDDKKTKKRNALLQSRSPACPAVRSERTSVRFPTSASFLFRS